MIYKLHVFNETFIREMILKVCSPIWFLLFQWSSDTNNQSNLISAGYNTLNNVIFYYYILLKYF